MEGLCHQQCKTILQMVAQLKETSLGLTLSKYRNIMLYITPFNYENSASSTYTSKHRLLEQCLQVDDFL